MGVDWNRDLYGDPSDDYFMQVLQLDKALENGYLVAQRYADNLKKFGIFPSGCGECDDSIALYEDLVGAINFEPSEGALQIIEREKMAELGLVRLSVVALVERILSRLDSKDLDGY